MGFFIVIIAGLLVLAVIGYAVLYAAVIFMLAIFGAACMLAYGVLYFILGDNNAGMALLLTIPLGIGLAVLFFNNFKGET